MTCNIQPENEGGGFVEFRRKVRSAEVLSAAMEQLLRMLQFTGKVSVVVLPRVEIRLRGGLLSQAAADLRVAPSGEWFVGPLYS